MRYAFDRKRIENGFITSVAVILLITGTAKVYSSTGSDPVLREYDPVLGLKYAAFLPVVGVVELCLAAILFLVRSTWVRCALVCWISANLLTYRILAELSGGHTFCRCLGSLTSAIGLSEQVVDTVLKAVVLYFVAGSLFLLIRFLPLSTGLRGIVGQPSDPPKGH